MVDLVEVVRFDDLLCELYSWDEVVVEGAHVLDVGCCYLLLCFVCFVGVALERLLAHDVLVGFGCCDRWFGVQVVRARVVEHLDAFVGDQLVLVGHVLGEVVVVRGVGYVFGIAFCDRH